jgi:hypothetical protein
MIRVHMVVEGQAEEGFANGTLVEPLAAQQIFIDARCVETSRTRARIYRGGLLDYQRAKRDLLRWMKQDQKPDAYFTTMFDLFRLPRDFPDREEARQCPDARARVQRLETALAADLAHPRFIPYIQLHEFEALLLSAPAHLEREFIDRGQEVLKLQNLCAKHESPELIDDGPETAPSKRIAELIPEYAARKASAGPRVAALIGLDTIRSKCPHFDDWLRRLEGLIDRAAPASSSGGVV